MIDHFELDAGEVVDEIGHEIGVFKIAQDEEVHHYAQGDERLSLPLHLVAIDRAPDQEIRQGGKEQDDEIEPAGCVVEEQGNRKQEDVATRCVLVHHTVPAHDQGNEDPEVLLGEEQRGRRIVGEPSIELFHHGAKDCKCVS